MPHAEPLIFAPNSTLADALDQVAPFLPEILMPRSSFEHSRRVAELFPTDTVNFFGFECRLADDAEGGGKGATDCALNLSSIGADALARGGIGPAGGPAHGLWQRIGQFYRRWEATHDEPFADAAATWLEFDCRGGDPVPNLLFGYWPDDPRIRRPWPWMQQKLLPGLFDGDYSAALRDSLDRCMAACPPGVGDFQIGLMLSRPIQAVRLCIFDLPIEAVPGYLDAIDWGGDRDALQRLLAAFRPHCDFIGLHFDVAARVFPHIGIEPNFRAGSWSRQPHREPRWQGIWQVLADEHLASPPKRDALLAWTGHQQVIVDGASTLLLRGLSHVKVTLAGDGSAHAKAYFGIALREAMGRESMKPGAGGR